VALVLVRVDSRLVHGQVVEGWVPHTGANSIVVANDELAENAFLRSVMELAGRSTLRISFCRVEEAPAAVAETEKRGEKAILICATTADAHRIRRTGVPFESLNIGNLHFASGRVEVSPSVFFAPEDFDEVEALSREGVAVVVRSTPQDAGTRLGSGGSRG
jgi:PTS system mannose-specific IIB component